MIVLGIESATSLCAAAVVSDGAVLAAHGVEGRHLHAERLMSMIDRALREAGVELSGLEAIAVSIGPGSFTGLRIGLSVVKGLALAASLPVVPVPTLEAIARHALRAGLAHAGGRILPVLDARRDEVYCQFFAPEANAVRPLEAERDLGVRELVGRLGEHPVLVTGEAAHRIRAELERPGGRAHPGITFAPPEAARCDAGVVALMGEERANAGGTAALNDLEPRYIKEFFLRTPH
jgi:tRNA threonylcarbamoyl adenosine modification protein YeaZ